MQQLPRTDTALHPGVRVLITRLHAGLSLLADDQHLTIDTDRVGRYVQFAAWDGCLRAESVGKAYLDESNALTGDERDWLERNGWNPEDAGGNLWRHWDPAQPLAAATVVAITLATVHGVSDVRHLRFMCENDTVLDAITASPT